MAAGHSAGPATICYDTPPGGARARLMRVLCASYGPTWDLDHLAIKYANAPGGVPPNAVAGMLPQPICSCLRPYPRFGEIPIKYTNAPGGPPPPPLTLTLWHMGA